MGRPRKYETEEERKQAYMLAQNKYSKKKTVCDVCQLTYNLGNKTSHLKSFTHLISSYNKIMVPQKC
jgi:hypothetical protein